MVRTFAGSRELAEQITHQVVLFSVFIAVLAKRKVKTQPDLLKQGSFVVLTLVANRSCFVTIDEKFSTHPFSF